MKELRDWDNASFRRGRFFSEHDSGTALHLVTMNSAEGQRDRGPTG
jgi:hypothetical protein